MARDDYDAKAWEAWWNPDYAAKAWEAWWNPQPSAVRDSGTREEFATGSVRDTREGKGRYDLITPLGLRRLAVHYENGAKKYGDRNWEKGQPVSRFLDSAARHLFAYLAGARDEDHLAAAAWNVMGAMHVEEAAAAGRLPSGLLDVPSAEDPQ